MNSQTDRTSYLLDKYGELLTLDDVRELLKYPSVASLLQAHRRGKLPIRLITIPERRGWFATTRQAINFFHKLEIDSQANPSDTGDTTMS